MKGGGLMGKISIITEPSVDLLGNAVDTSPQDLQNDSIARLNQSSLWISSPEGRVTIRVTVKSLRAV